MKHKADVQNQNKQQNVVNNGQQHKVINNDQLDKTMKNDQQEKVTNNDQQPDGQKKKEDENTEEIERRKNYAAAFEKKNPTIYFCLGAKSYSAVAAGTFAFMALSGTDIINEAIVFIRDKFTDSKETQENVKKGLLEHLNDKVTPTAKKVYEIKKKYDETLNEGASKATGIFFQNYQENLTIFFVIMALLHLMLVCVSSPKIFYMVATIYNLSKWGDYAIAILLYCIFVYHIILLCTPERKEKFEIAKRAIVALIWGIIIHVYGASMEEASKVYYQYAEYLEQQQAREEQDKNENNP